MPTFRVAILECDTPLDKVLDKYGSYGDIFTALLKQASEEVSSDVGEKVQVECTNYDVVTKQEYPEDLDKVDAILMTGSSKFYFISPQYGILFGREKTGTARAERKKKARREKPCTQNQY